MASSATPPGTARNAEVAITPAPLFDVNYWHRDERRRRAKEFYERIAPVRDVFKRRNWYYHQQLERFCRFMIPPGSNVLEIGCGNGSLLASLEPRIGVGVDWCSAFVEQARARYPHLRFHADDAEGLELSERFDYVVLSDLLGVLVDVQRALEGLKRVCHKNTRIIITDHNYLWEPVLRFGQAVGWAIKHPAQNWLPTSVIATILDLAGFEVIRIGGRMVMPLYVPMLSPLLNRVVARLPLIERLCLVRTVVARPRRPTEIAPAATCSVVVPCRNERGTIRAIVERIPDMGGPTEIILVDGHSTDGTVEEIERVIREQPGRNLKFLKQIGTGKGDAVRQGFAAATGDILMILDADMTVAPEELPKFYQALVSGYGEFINGTRLVYPMDGQAMQLLNLVANKAFSSLFSYLLEQRFHDTLCGTKALWRTDYEKIAAQRSYFGDLDPFGDFDLLFGASRLNLKIREVPVRYTERVYGETNIRRFAHGWQLLKMCWTAMPRLKFAP